MVVMKELSHKTKRYIEACQKQSTDSYGDAAIRLTRFINEEAGAMLCEAAQWQNVTEAINELHERYLETLKLINEKK